MGVIGGFFATELLSVLSDELINVLKDIGEAKFKELSDTQNKIYHQFPKEVREDYESMLRCLSLEKCRRFEFNSSKIVDDFYKSNTILDEAYRPQVVMLVGMIVENLQSSLLHIGPTVTNILKEQNTINQKEDLALDGIQNIQNILVGKRISKKPIEQVRDYLEKCDNWVKDEDDENTIFYYDEHPEYTITLIKDDGCKGYEYYMFSQPDYRPFWYNAIIKYNNTVLARIPCVALNGCRFMVVAPKIEISNGLCYAYYYSDSLEYSLLCFLRSYYRALWGNEILSSYCNFGEYIICFESERDKIDFDNYVKKNHDNINSRITKNSCSITASDISAHQRRLFSHQCAEAKMLSKIFNEMMIISQITTE